MEVTFSPEVLDELKQAAATSGKTAEQLVEEITTNALSARSSFLQGVARGKSDIQAGNFVEHDKMMRELDELLQS